MSAGIANVDLYADSQKLDAIPIGPYRYASASAPKWPQKQSQSIKISKIFLGSIPPDPPSLACLCMHSSIYPCYPFLKTQDYSPDSNTLHDETPGTNGILEISNTSCVGVDVGFCGALNFTDPLVSSYNVQ